MHWLSHGPPRGLEREKIIRETRQGFQRDALGISSGAGRDSRMATGRGDEGEGEKLLTEVIENLNIIPGLTNDIALDIFVRVPRVLQARCRAVCSSWKHAMEPAVMHSMRKMLHIPEVWLVAECRYCEKSFLPCETVFRVMDVLRDRCYRFPRSQLVQVCGSETLRYSYFCTVGHEVLIVAAAHPRWHRRHQEAFSTVKEMEGLYSFDVVRMEWNSGKYASLPGAGDVWAARAVDIAGGYLYASRKHVERFVTVFKHKMLRLDLKTKMWEELHGHLYLAREDFRGVMLQNRLCIFPGGKYDYTNAECTYVPDIWPVDGNRGQSFFHGVAVVMGGLYGLRNLTGAWRNITQLIHYETSSREWICLGNVPASDDRVDRNYRFGRTLFGVGEELWVFGRDSRTIWTTKPSGSQPLSWRSHFVSSYVSLDLTLFVAAVLV